MFFTKRWLSLELFKMIRVTSYHALFSTHDVTRDVILLLLQILSRDHRFISFDLEKIDHSWSFLK